MKKEKVWTIKEATSFIEFLDEYDLIDYISEPKRDKDTWTYTIKLKIDDRESNRSGN